MSFAYLFETERYSSHFYAHNLSNDFLKRSFAKRQTFSFIP